MRKNIVAGNWKMNQNSNSAKELFNGIQSGLNNGQVEVIVFPPSLYVQNIVETRSNTQVKVGVQNFYPKDSGAFTGEISTEQINDLGIEYALVGHSERREYFQEDESFLKDKVDALLSKGITPVFCCGEPLDIRDSGSHVEFVSKQIESSLFHLSEEEFRKVVVAYEPIWAIGTGVTASSDQAQDMHKSIRGLISNKYGSEVADVTSILYGGSCKPENAHELFSKPDVDGGLIGGASLKPDSFLAIVDSF